MTNDQQGKVVTFYSYKGGTGRTMALANVAWILASNGKRVLVVDWDLESPGLNRFFHPFIDPLKLQSAGGVIKMLGDYELQMTKRGPRPADWYKPFAAVQGNAFSLSWDHFPDEGTLDILIAGRQNLDYPATVSALNWDTFYDLGGGTFLDALKENMKQHYDYTLIDSRTGLGDVASICTAHLPDILVDCFTLTDQGIDGSAGVAATIRNRYQNRNIRILPVPMRVERSEMAKVRISQAVAMQRFVDLPAGLSEQERRLYWDNVQVPYVPYFAFEETLAAFAGDAAPGSLLSAYERLTSYITGVETRLPLISERLRAQTAIRFERRIRPAVAEVVLCHGDQDELWVEWIEQVLLAAGVRVREWAPEIDDGEGSDQATRLLVLSDTSASELATRVQAGADPLGIYISTMSPVAYLPPENAVSIAGLDERDAIDHILRLVGQLDRSLPARLNARFPANPPALFVAPVKNPRFTGRDDKLREIRTQLRQRAGSGESVTLHGPTAVGKTQIALQYAHRYANAYDLVFWVDAADSSETVTFIDTQLAGLASYMRLDPQPTITDAVGSVLAALSAASPYSRWLLIYDSADFPDRDQRYLPPRGGSVLVTSSDGGWSQYSRLIDIDKFDRPESVAHLRVRVPAMSVADAERIAEAVDDMPLSVVNAGALIAERGTTTERYLEMIESGEDPVPAAYALTFERLQQRSPAAFRLLQLLSVMALGVSLDFVYSDPFSRVLQSLDPSVANREEREQLVQHLSRFALVKVSPRSVVRAPEFGEPSFDSDPGARGEGGTLTLHKETARRVRDYTASQDPEALDELRHDVHHILVGARPALEVDDPGSWPAYRLLWPHLEASRALDSDDPAVRQLMIDRVRYVWIHNAFDQAEAKARETVDAWSAALGRLTDQTAHRALEIDLLRLQFNYANILRSQGKFEQAWELDSHVLRRQTELLGESHPQALVTRGGLGGDLRALGRYAEALETDEATYAAWQEVTPPNQARMLASLNNLAVSTRLMGRFHTALELDRSVYDGRRRVLGADHPNTLTSLSNVGRDLREVGQYEESIAQLERVVGSLRNVYGAKSRWTLTALANFAVSLRTAGRSEEARAAIEEVYTALLEAIGPSHFDTLACRLTRALTLIALDLTGEARSELDALRQSYELSLGPAHPHTLVCVNNQAAAAAILGDLEAAELLAADAAKRLGAAIGADHPYTLAAQTNLAATLAERREFGRAVERAEDAIVRLGGMLGPTHPDTLRCEANLVLMQGEMGVEPRHAKAQITRRLTASFGAGHSAVVSFREGRYLHRTVDPHPF